MIKIDLNEDTTLDFKLNVKGTNKEPKARLLLPISEHINIMLEGEVSGDMVYVTVPHKMMQMFEGKRRIDNVGLEVIIGEEEDESGSSLHYAWSGQVELTTKVKVEATVAGSRNKSTVKVEATTVDKDKEFVVETPIVKSEVESEDSLDDFLSRKKKKVVERKPPTRNRLLDGLQQQKEEYGLMETAEDQSLVNDLLKGKDVNKVVKDAGGWK
jgi:hypothetical protein